MRVHTGTYTHTLTQQHMNTAPNTEYIKPCVCIHAFNEKHILLPFSKKQFYISRMQILLINFQTYTKIVIIIHKQVYNLTPYILWIWYIKSSATADTVIISFEWIVCWLVAAAAAVVAAVAVTMVRPPVQRLIFFEIVMEAAKEGMEWKRVVGYEMLLGVRQSLLLARTFPFFIVKYIFDDILLFRIRFWGYKCLVTSWISF